MRSYAKNNISVTYAQLKRAASRPNAIRWNGSQLFFLALGAPARCSAHEAPNPKKTTKTSSWQCSKSEATKRQILEFKLSNQKLDVEGEKRRGKYFLYALIMGNFLLCFGKSLGRFVCGGEVQWASGSMNDVRNWTRESSHFIASRCCLNWVWDGGELMSLRNFVSRSKPPDHVNVSSKLSLLGWHSVTRL